MTGATPGAEHEQSEAHQQPSDAVRDDTGWTPPAAEPSYIAAPANDAAPMSDRQPESSPAAHAETAAPRRRSTVRERVTLITDAGDVITGPSTSSAPAVEPPATSSDPTDAGDASKPRRTGWWAKRLLGE
jgi:ribonuclease E